MVIVSDDHDRHTVESPSECHAHASFVLRLFDADGSQDVILHGLGWAVSWR